MSEVAGTTRDSVDSLVTWPVMAPCGSSTPRACAAGRRFAASSTTACCAPGRRSRRRTSPCSSSMLRTACRRRTRRSRTSSWTPAERSSSPRTSGTWSRRRTEGSSGSRTRCSSTRGRRCCGRRRRVARACTASVRCSSTSTRGGARARRRRSVNDMIQTRPAGAPDAEGDGQAALRDAGLDRAADVRDLRRLAPARATYQRYLENRLRRTCAWTGVPIRLRFRPTPDVASAGRTRPRWLSCRASASILGPPRAVAQLG